MGFGNEENVISTSRHACWKNTKPMAEVDIFHEGVDVRLVLKSGKDAALTDFLEIAVWVS